MIGRYSHRVVVDSVFDEKRGVRTLDHLNRKFMLDFFLSAIDGVRKEGSVLERYFGMFERFFRNHVGIVINH